jgi:hypothetical protein
MVPNISRNGRSFRGAGAYHLHDKPDAAGARPRTSERVAFTAARNLANADPRAALDEMWRTAEDASHLKACSGVAPTGRKNETPVKTVSLAWAPGQSPAREEMCLAADSFMKAMGWAEHQALIVAHNDTRHPHIHLIINRVHPDTGRALNDWQERKRAQVWAHDYERQHGAILCPARQASGVKPIKASLPHREARLLKSQDGAARRRIAREARAAFRPAWAAHYGRQRAALARFDRHARTVERVASALLRRGDSHRAMNALEELDRQRAALLQSFRRQRAVLARTQHAAVRLLAAADVVPSTPATTEKNDLAALMAMREANTGRVPPNATHAGIHRLTAFHRSSPTGGSSRPDIARPSHVVRRARLLFHAAARELLRRPRAAPRHVLSRARSEIAIAFAHRWAAIRRMPPEERAAAAAALRSEEAAALAARTAHLLEELKHETRSHGATRQARFAARRALHLNRRRESWRATPTLAAATIPAPRRPRLLPLPIATAPPHSKLE